MIIIHSDIIKIHILILMKIEQMLNIHSYFLKKYLKHTEFWKKIKNDITLNNKKHITK